MYARPKEEGNKRQSWGQELEVGEWRRVMSIFVTVAVYLDAVWAGLKGLDEFIMPIVVEMRPLINWLTVSLLYSDRSHGRQDTSQMLASEGFCSPQCSIPMPIRQGKQM